MFIVSCCFIFKKTILKLNILKKYFNLIKSCTSAIFSTRKSFLKFITFLSVYYSSFIFNSVIKNERSMSKIYRKKIIKSLLIIIYLLILNTYKAIITSLKLDL